MDCPECGAMNSDDDRFCGDCGTSLVVVCAACGTPSRAGRRYCGSCGAVIGTAQPIAEPSQPPPTAHHEERRLATVLFCDLAGFTSMSERMDHEDVKALASRCTELMSAEVRRYGGTVTSVMGDAIMAVFGAPVAHEDDPERAVRAALSIRGLVGSVHGAPTTLEVHAGINTGEITAGHVGTVERQDYTAMGDATNTAARLMGAAPPGSVLVGELTFAATRHTVEYDEIPPIVAKGKSEPVRAWAVRDVAAVAAARPLGTAPFVGRQAELAELETLWRAACLERRVRSASVVGPAGIGKTRLLRETVGALPDVERVLWGRCLAYGEGITYWPLIELVESAAGILRDDATPVKSEKLATLVASLAGLSLDETRSTSIALANLIAVPVAPDGAVEATPITQGELHWGVARVLKAIAADRPTVVVLEDLHWAEPALLEFVTTLVSNASAVPLLVLMTARPEALETWALPTGGDNRVLRLAGLDDAASRTILADLLGTGTGATIRGDALLRNADGNPLFLEETVRMLASASERGEESGEVADIPIPTSVQGLIGSRLDLLPVEQQRLAQRGSVVGQLFWTGAVAHLAGSTVGVASGLDDLVFREVLELHRQSSVAGEHEYAFRHILIRDVAYRRLPRGERSVLHDRCSSWIAALPGGAAELIELVAYHLEQACVLAPAFGTAAEARPVRRAVDALVAAAEKAEHREGLREAHRFYVRALEVVRDEMPELATELRLRRARMTAALGELSRADDELRTVIAEARTAHRVDLVGPALVSLANVHLKQGRARDAGAWLDEARAIALETDDRWLSVRTSYEFSALWGDFEGDADRAIVELRAAAVVAEALGDRTLRVEGLLRESNLLVNLGRLAEAEVVVGACAALAGQLESRRDEARATFLLALVTSYRVGARAAEPLGLRAHEWLERIGDGYFLPQSLRALAKYALADGRPALAEDRLRQALALAAPGGGWLVVELYRYLTEALVELGRVDDAAATAALARAAVPEEDAYARAAALLCEGLVALSALRVDEASSSFAEAIGLMEDQQLWIDVAEARLLYADGLVRAGATHDALAELEASRALFEPMGADAMLALIDRRVNSLRAAPAT